MTGMRLQRAATAEVAGDQDCATYFARMPLLSKKQQATTQLFSACSVQNTSLIAAAIMQGNTRSAQDAETTLHH